MTRKQSDQLIFDEQHKPYYNIIGKDYICKKCNHIIKQSKLKHVKSCIGLGTQAAYKKLTTDINKKLDFHSEKCDLGCGNDSKFFHKNGKAYCCNLGNACPVKIKKDSEIKKGKNPFKNGIHPRGGLGKTPWNKGLTKDTSESVKKCGDAIRVAYETNGDQRKKIHHTEESKAKIAKATKDRKQGGYKQGSGRGKKGWYKGFYCDSSWELAYVIYCLEHSIDIKRNTEWRQYEWEGQIKNYIPDFIVNGALQEIKGYDSRQWRAKIAANPDVKVFFEKDLKEVFKYVRNKYGKDYIRLYEKPNLETKL